VFERGEWNENIPTGSICKQLHRGKVTGTVTVLRYIPRTRCYHVYNPQTFEDYYLDCWELKSIWQPENGGT
jgi:hypothetical protein